MIELTLRTIMPTVSFKAVNASKGKQARAEPVAALYEQGKVRHVGGFPALLRYLLPLSQTSVTTRLGSVCARQ
jgi:phage terminase large subunit-like protein